MRRPASSAARAARSSPSASGSTPRRASSGSSASTWSGSKTTTSPNVRGSTKSSCSLGGPASDRATWVCVGRGAPVGGEQQLTAHAQVDHHGVAACPAGTAGTCRGGRRRSSSHRSGRRSPRWPRSAAPCALGRPRPGRCAGRRPGRRVRAGPSRPRAAPASAAGRSSSRPRSRPRRRPARRPSWSGPCPRRAPRRRRMTAAKNRLAWSGPSAAGRVHRRRAAGHRRPAPAGATCGPAGRDGPPSPPGARPDQPLDEVVGRRRAAVDVHGTEHGLQRVGQDRRLLAAAGSVLTAGRGAGKSPSPRSLGHGRQRQRVDHALAHTGQVTLGQIGEAAERQIGDDPAEHGIAEELEALVAQRPRVFGAPRPMSHRPGQQLGVGELVPDALGEGPLVTLLDRRQLDQVGRQAAPRVRSWT